MYEIFRGNKDNLEIHFTGIDGEPYMLGAGDIITLSVREYGSVTARLLLDKTVVVEVATDVVYIDLLPADTMDIPAGEYMYDVTLTEADSDIYTVCGADTFTVLESLKGV